MSSQTRTTNINKKVLMWLNTLGTCTNSLNQALGCGSGATLLTEIVLRKFIGTQIQGKVTNHTNRQQVTFINHARLLEQCRRRPCFLG